MNFYFYFVLKNVYKKLLFVFNAKPARIFELVVDIFRSQRRFTQQMILHFFSNKGFKIAKSKSLIFYKYFSLFN